MKIELQSMALSEHLHSSSVSSIDYIADTPKIHWLLDNAALWECIGKKIHSHKAALFDNQYIVEDQQYSLLGRILTYIFHVHDL